MRAVSLDHCGGREVLVVSDVPVPTRKEGEVLIKVVSAGVNPVDLLVASGAYKPAAFPKILGGDVAGIVEEAGEGSKFKQGDKVFALTPGFFSASSEGCYAEFVAAEEGWVAHVPDNLPLEHAAGLPLVALTAWQALQQAKPKAGQRVVINAASGGVGHVAVQLAKALDLYVVGIAGPKNVEWVKSLGADEVVDYSIQDVAEVYKEAPFDIAIDCMGTRSGLLQKLLAVTKPAGHVSHIFNAGTDNAVLEAAQAAHAAGTGPSLGTTLVQANGEQLQEIAELVAAGRVRLEVAQTLPLEQVAEAHAQVATGHTRGKVVLTV